MARIVLIEDVDCMRMVLKQTLEDLGHAVSAAADGRAGLRQIRDFAPDLVITDINMPHADGLEVIREMRLLDRRLKVLAMSGGGVISAPELLTMARLLGACAVLRKPFTPADLQGHITAALRVENPAPVAATSYP